MHYYYKHNAFGLEILRCVLFNAENLSECCVAMLLTWFQNWRWVCWNCMCNDGCGHIHLYMSLMVMAVSSEVVNALFQLLHVYIVNMSTINKPTTLLIPMPKGV